MDFPEIPTTPIKLWNRNTELFRELGRDKYFLFAQIYFMVTIPTLLKGFVTDIQKRRTILGINDCNYDVISMRELGRNNTAFLTAIQRSGSPEAAKAIIDGYLNMVVQYYWPIMHTYVDVGTTSDEYFDQVFSLAKIHMHDEQSRKKGGKPKTRKRKLRK